MTDPAARDVCVVGGGPAGLTTALYTTRLGHDTVVLEASGGRHAAVEHVHNLYGVSEDVSGQELSAHAVDQLTEYGGHHRESRVTAVSETDGAETGFEVTTADGDVAARRVVFATGFRDREPDVPELTQFAGRGLYYCLHCDLFGLGGAPAYVLGHDDHAAEVALILLNVTADVDLLLDGAEPTWSEETERQLRAHPVERTDTPVTGSYPAEATTSGPNEAPRLGGLRFADGTERDYRGGFAVYGSEYGTDLPAALGCELAADGALAVGDDQQTSVDGVYGVGDVTHGQNQTTIAMGDGARAGIAIHKDLREFPRPVGENGDVDPGAVPAAPAELRERMARVRTQDAHAGLRAPSPER